jgi:type IV secretory pathway VirB10-like protein
MPASSGIGAIPDRLLTQVAVRLTLHMNSRVACLLAAMLLASACVTSRAAMPVERPPLEVPPVPPRIVEPAPAPETNLEPVNELPPEKPATSAARAKPPAPRDTSRDTPKPPEPKPPETSPLPVEPTPPAAASNAPQVRTPATVDTAAAKQQVRQTLDKAQKRLDSIDYHRLNGDGQKNYNDAKAFMERAEAAIKASNFELAKGLASNAEKLANEIQTR